MNQPLTLPSLDPIPEDIDDQLRRLLQTPAEPALESWLLELIRNSGHMSTGGDMRWRLLAIVWLAAGFDIDQAWPYLMWLNMNEPVMGDHLSEIWVETLDEFEAHVQMANWLANNPDERLATFFRDFSNIPALRTLPALFNRLLARPTAPETGIWLAAFYRDTAEAPSPPLRRWRLLAAAWYATCFNASEGLTYLETFTNDAGTLSPADNRALMEAAGEINGGGALHQWIAACPNEQVRTMLRDFGYYELENLAQTRLEEKPDYEHLAHLEDQAQSETETFKRNLQLLDQAGITPKSGRLLDLACGPLAPQTVLLSSAGYQIVGVDLQIPPQYLPLPSLKFWLKRRRHVKAWEQATTPFFQTLARQAGLKLKWNKAAIALANLTRLQFEAGSFAAVICANYLEQAPDVDGLLAEVARVLPPDGILVADIRPYAGLGGAFQPLNGTPPWDHLRQQHHPWLPLNQWREAQFRAAIEQQFSIERWLTEQDSRAQALLTPDIQAELSSYSEEELTRRQIVVVARKTK